MDLYKSNVELNITEMKIMGKIPPNIFRNGIEFKFSHNDDKIEVYKCIHECKSIIRRRIFDGFYKISDIHDDCYNNMNSMELSMLNKDILDYVKTSAHIRMLKHIKYANKYDILIRNINKIITGVKRKLHDGYESEVDVPMVTKKRKLER